MNQTHEVSLRGGGLGHWPVEHGFIHDSVCSLIRMLQFDVHAETADELDEINSV